ncbi:unnamed protein product, partial [Staurois parvus]
GTSRQGSGQRHIGPDSGQEAHPDYQEKQQAPGHQASTAAGTGGSQVGQQGTWAPRREQRQRAPGRSKQAPGPPGRAAGTGPLAGHQASGAPQAERRAPGPPRGRQVRAPRRSD